MTMILKIKYVNSGLAIITKFSAVEPTSATQSLTFVNLEHVKMTHNFVQMDRFAMIKLNALF